MLTRTGLLIALALAAMLVIACSSSKPEMLPVDSAPICKEMSEEAWTEGVGDTLVKAAYSNCASVARQLLADVGGIKKLKDAFRKAINQNSADVAKVLIDHWQDTNELSEIINKPLSVGAYDHPLHIAARTRSTAWWESLGEPDVLPDSSRGALEVAKLLIEHGADVNGRNRSHDMTPLHVLARNRGDAVELAKLLIESGANINAKYGRDGQERSITPLHEAVSCCFDADHHGAHLGLTKLLINNGAAINAKTEGYMWHGVTHTGGWTALHNSVAAWQDTRKIDDSYRRKWAEEINANTKEIVKFLIENGAAVNAYSDNDTTPLSIAQNVNAVDIAKLLIENGANTTGIDLSWMESQ